MLFETCMAPPTKPAPVRTNSCHGVSFEASLVRVNLPLPPTAPIEDEADDNHAGSLVWVPWARRKSFSVHPLDHTHQSMSRTSSHFCDVVDFDAEGIKSVTVAEEVVEGLKLHEEVKPQPRSAESRLSIIMLDQGLLTVYKRLFAVCFTLNVFLLVLAITGRFPYAKDRAADFSLVNILVLTLCRSEACLRVLFWLAIKVLGRPSIPLPIKTATTSFLQSLGGIHSSCGVSSVVWFIYALVLTLHTSTTTVAVASAILSLLCLSCMAALPLVRHLHHNVFERTHRFAGWAALALLWVFVMLTTGSKLTHQRELWLTVAITFFTIFPWVTVRRVPVSVSAPSGHAAIIKFAGGIKAGILGRISRSPLSEWHAFGIISNGKDGHMMIAGAVGDFTRGLVSDPPSHLWVRRVHFAGLPYLVNMYNRVVLVATGSGICVFMSFLLQPCAADVCFVWVTKGVEHNFGTEIKEMLSGYPRERVIVHDTAVSGRPNVAEMSIETARNWKAEVVIVTSNPQGSRDIVRACRAAGIHAFGPIWDS